jgi:hypothetical protein
MCDPDHGAGNYTADGHRRSLGEVIAMTRQARGGSARAGSTRTDTQLELVRWTASLGAVSAEALAIRAEIGPRSARSRLAGANRRGLLDRARPLAELPALYMCTTAGLRACRANVLTPARVGPATAAHMYACARVAALLERRYPDHVLLGECELRATERVCGRPFATAELGRDLHDRPLLHRCDLALLPRSQPNALPVAVEVELTVKAPARLATICRAWGRCRQVAGVVYVAPPAVGRALERALRRAQAHDRVVVIGLDALSDALVDAAARHSLAARGSLAARESLAARQSLADTVSSQA